MNQLQFIVAALAALISTTTVACSTATSKHAGDGVFLDKGIGAIRPRYEIRFPEISLAKPGEYVFTSEGLPSVPLTFVLELADSHRHQDETTNKGWMDEYEEIKRIQTWIHVSLSTDGRTLGSNAGSIKDSWTLAWYPNGGDFWHPNCRNILFKRNRPARIRIEVKNVDADAPPLTVVPVLSGGGVELP